MIASQSSPTANQFSKLDGSLSSQDHAFPKSVTNDKMDLSKAKMSEAFGAAMPSPIFTAVRGYLLEAARTHSDKIAIISMHQPHNLIPIDFPEHVRKPVNSGRNYLCWTYGQLHHASKVLVSSLKTQGVKSGTPIATLINSGIEWPVVALAAIMLRCPFVPLNPKVVVNRREAEHMLRISGARVLVIADLPLFQKLEESLPDLMGEMMLKIVLQTEQTSAKASWIGFQDLFSAPICDLTSTEAVVDFEEDNVMTLFTSGTTSLPKGVACTNMTLASALQVWPHISRLDSTNRSCLHMPTYHMVGAIITLAYLSYGASIVYPAASFDAGSSLDAISQEQCTNVMCVPAILQAMVDHPKMPTTDTTSLRRVEMGATTILPESYKQIFSVLKSPSASNGYGMSEGVPMATRDIYPNDDYKNAGVGPVPPGTRMRICAPNSREPVRRGEAGEIHVGGAHIIKSYMKGASPESFYTDQHGHWLTTGDQGIMADDGELTISGRYKDMIIRGGENIAPASIEAAFDTELGIFAQVIGVRSDEAGEVPVAIVPSALKIPASSIRKAVLEVLGAAFVPEKIYTLAELGLKDYPRTASGKVKKVDLKSIVQKYEDDLDASDIQFERSHSQSNLESKLVGILHRVVDIDANQVTSDTNFGSFADSLTLMRFRNRIKRVLGLDAGAEQLVGSATLKSLALYLSSQTTASNAVDLNVHREGPPQTDDISISLGDPRRAARIQEEVEGVLEPHGFTWENDVEDIVPSWDFGHQVFGSVAGSGKVNHRMIFSTKLATTEEVLTVLAKTLEYHPMLRSFEVQGLNGEPPMHVIMRPNTRWLQYFLAEIPEVDNQEELVSLINSGAHFAEIEAPYPSLLIRVAHIKTTNSIGMIWASQHSAFDAFSIGSFIEDLDSYLENPMAITKNRAPYKLWADNYYLLRNSLAARRSVNYHVRKLSTISQLSTLLFPPTPSHDLPERPVTQRLSFRSNTFSIELPHLSKLQADHEIPPFIVLKAALALFLAHTTNSDLALFSQYENGRTWPFLEPWTQSLLPPCLDLAGPTVERTLNLLRINPKESVLSYLKHVQTDQEESAPHIHGPWNLVREELGPQNAAVFDAVAERICLNFLPTSTKEGLSTFRNLSFLGEKTNAEGWLNLNCGMEDRTNVWMAVYGDEDRVSKRDAEQWIGDILNAAKWIAEVENWEKPLGSFVF